MSRRPGVVLALCSVAMVCGGLMMVSNRAVAQSTPTVSFSPNGGTYSTPSVSVTITWCDAATRLDPGSWSVQLNYIDVSASFNYSSAVVQGCRYAAHSTGTITLQNGGNVLVGSINNQLGGSGSGSAFFTYTQVPLVDTSAHNGYNHDVSKCVADCFDGVVSYTTPAYTSMDQARAVTLLYRNQQASPIALVTVDAEDNSGKTVSKLSIKVKNSSNVWQNILGSAEEVFYRDTANRYQRLAAQFDASGLSTGVYHDTVVVTSYYTDNSQKSASWPVRVLVVNEQSSLYGAGWSVAGVQRVYAQGDGTAVVTDGTGSIAYFGGGSCFTAPCSYASPQGDFSVLSRHSGWSDTTVFDRKYPDGTTVAYWSSGYEAYVKDRYGNKTTYVFDSSHRLSTITDPAGKVITFSYSSGAYTITDPGGRVTTVTLNGPSNVVSIRDPAGGYPFQNGTYDSRHQLTGWSDRRGGAWNVAYDCWYHAGTKTMPTVTAMINGSLQTTRPAVQVASADDQVAVCSTSGTGTSANPAAPVIGANVRGTVWNARGYATKYQLDPFGAPLRIEEPLGRTTVFSRLQASQVIYSRSPSGDAVVYTWSGPDLIQTYDSTTTLRTTMAYEQTYHQLVMRTNGLTKDTLYWSSGKLDSMDVGQQGSQNRWLFHYESIGGRVTGRVTDSRDPRNHWVTRAYQTTGFLNLGSITENNRFTGYTVDAFGRDSTVLDPHGNLTTVTYDVLNRVRRIVGALPDTTTYGYDSLYLTSMTDAKHQLYRVAPNALGWDTIQVDPGGRVDTLKYDVDGNVVAHVNRRSQTVTFTYNALDRDSTRAADGRTTTYAADPSDRFLYASNSESTDTARYDAAGRVAAEVTLRNGSWYTRTSTYNTYSLRTNLQVSPWSDAIAFHYDALLRLDTLTDAAGGKTLIGYNNDRQVSSIKLPTTPALTISRDYPSQHTPALINYSDATINNTIGTDYTYTDNAQVKTRINVGQTNSQVEAGRWYSYDAAYRLSGYAGYSLIRGTPPPGCGGGLGGSGTDQYGNSCYPESSRYTSDSVVYSYDLVGNRADSGAKLDAGNRLRIFNTDSLVYDADGNLTLRYRSGSLNQQFYWNSLGQLDSAWTVNVGTVRFGYDGLGRRVRKTSPSGTPTYYLYDGANLLAELDGSGNRQAEYTYYPGVDNPHSVRRWRSGIPVAYYYATEYPGNVVGVVNAAGTLVGSYAYAPFGAIQSAVDTVPNTLKFAARELDSETGLYYMRARYYDPSFGRFISEDPIGLAGGINVYAYTADNPVNTTDASGLTCEGNKGGSGDYEWSYSLNRWVWTLPAVETCGDSYTANALDAMAWNESVSWGMQDSGSGLDDVQAGGGGSQTDLGDRVKKAADSFLYKLRELGWDLSQQGCSADEVFSSAVKASKWAAAGGFAAGFAHGAAVGGTAGAIVGGAVLTVPAPGVGTALGAIGGGLAGAAGFGTLEGLTVGSAAGVGAFGLELVHSAVECMGPSLLR